MTNVRAYDMALTHADKWEWTAIFYANVGDEYMARFCERVADYFYKLAHRFI